MEMNQPDTANFTFAIMVDALLRLGPVDIGSESAKVPYALQAWASRRVVAALRQGGTTTACDAHGTFPEGSAGPPRPECALAALHGLPARILA